MHSRSLDIANESSQQGSNRDKGSNSLSGIISTLVPVLIISSIIFVVFLVLRAKIARVYRPRTLDYVLHEEYVISRVAQPF
jgi:Late exocytosis, associated with Golgi transport